MRGEHPQLSPKRGLHMNIKLAFASAVLAVAALPAMAADQSIDLSSGFASFGSTAPLLQGGDDVLTFTGLATGTYDFTVSFTGQFISDLAGSLNGSALAVNTFGVFRFGYDQGVSPSPLVLTLTGSTFTSPLASYSVTMSATPVPEPGTLALLLAGVGVLGFVARRRSL